MIAAMVVDLLRFPPPDRRPGWAVIETLKMWALLPVAGIAFGVLPALDAQTKLALGLPLEWKVTPKKVRSGARAVGESTPEAEL